MPDLTLKRGDTREALRATLEALDPATATAKVPAYKPIPLGEALAVHVYLYTRQTEEGKARRVKTGAVTIVDAQGGKIEYRWEPDDLVKAGTYQLEFEITWGDGTVQTVPNDGYYTIEVLEDLGPTTGEE